MSYEAVWYPSKIMFICGNMNWKQKKYNYIRTQHRSKAARMCSGTFPIKFSSRYVKEFKCIISVKLN
jgi:hypothetical protein